MKIRNGFVSNSSSSSFIIPLYKLTDKQKQMIYDSSELAAEIDNKLNDAGKEPKYEWYDQWDIAEDNFCISLATSMTNFDLQTFIIDEVGLKDLNKIMLFEDESWGAKDIFENKEYKTYLRRKKLLKIKELISMVKKKHF